MDKLNVERVEQAMRAAGIAKRKDLAERVGVHPIQVTRWLNKNAMPDWHNLVKLCLVLQCSRAYLLGMEHDPEYLQLLRIEVGEALGPTAQALFTAALSAINDPGHPPPSDPPEPPTPFRMPAAIPRRPGTLRPPKR